MKKKSYFLVFAAFLLTGIVLGSCDSKPKIEPDKTEIRNAEDHNSEKNDSTKTNSTINGWETEEGEDVDLTIKPAK